MMPAILLGESCMVTEVERERDIENWKRMQFASDGGSGGDGSDGDGLGGGDMGRDRKLLLEILDDLIADLGVFGQALDTPALYEFVREGTDRTELLHMGQLAHDMIANDAIPKLKVLRADLEINYPLRHAFLFSAGLTGNPLFFKRQVSKKWGLPKDLAWTDRLAVVTFLNRARENFEMGAKILGSLEEALKEFPGIKTLLEAIDELLSIFDFWSRHITRQHNSRTYPNIGGRIIFA